MDVCMNECMPLNLNYLLAPSTGNVYVHMCRRASISLAVNRLEVAYVPLLLLLLLLLPVPTGGGEMGYVPPLPYHMNAPLVA